MIAALAGSFLGLVLGGVLAAINWRMVFLVNVPIGIVRDDLGVLEAQGHRRAASGAHRLAGQRDVRRWAWACCSGVTYGIQPYGGSQHRLGQPDGARR